MIDTYSSAAQAVQTQFVGEFTDSHRIGKILFVSKHQKNRILQLILLDLQGESCDRWHINIIDRLDGVTTY